MAATASYGRTNQNPDGDANAQGWNEIIRRSFWLAAAALELNSEPLFENPKDTFLFKTSFANILPNPAAFLPTLVLLGAFGAATKKAICIFSRLPWLSHLSNRSIAGRTFLQASTTYQDAEGNKRFTSNALTKLSQIYPLPFAREFAGLFHQHMPVAPNNGETWLSPALHVSPRCVEYSEKQIQQLKEAALVAPGVDELRVAKNISRLGVPLVDCLSDPGAHDIQNLMPVASSIHALGIPPWSFVCVVEGTVYIMYKRNWHRLLIQKEARGKKKAYAFITEGTGNARSHRCMNLGTAVLVEPPAELSEATDFHVKKKPCLSRFRS